MYSMLELEENDVLSKEPKLTEGLEMNSQLHVVSPVPTKTTGEGGMALKTFFIASALEHTMTSKTTLSLYNN